MGSGKRSQYDGRVVVYTHDEDRVALEAKARAGVIPIVTNTPGYISYGVMFEGDGVVSVSQWESEEHAKAADAALAKWVNANTSIKSQTRFTGDFAWAGTRRAVGRCSGTGRSSAAVGDRLLRLSGLSSHRHDRWSAAMVGRA